MKTFITCGIVGCSDVGDSPTTFTPKVPIAASSIDIAPLQAISFEAIPLPYEYQRGDTGLYLPVEPIGGGVAVLDYDGDGDLDLFFSQGGRILPDSPGAELADVLLRNDGETFVDVGTDVGLTPKGYGVGVTVADYDADGDPDIYVTRYGRNTLWKNDQGKFVDVTEIAKVGCEAWSLGAAFADFDRDGDLDLFVTNYIDFDPTKAPYRRNAKTGEPEYGLPGDFEGLPDVLYRNDGGVFTDITQRAGISGKTWGMGVLAADIDNDGWMDVLVANDGANNVVWRNKGDGGFEDVASFLGLACNKDGRVEADMGIAFGDVDANGLPDLFITHFLYEHDTLWLCQKGRGADDLYYRDETISRGLGRVSRDKTGWGTSFADFDQDGDLDLIVANGHIREWPLQQMKYSNPPTLWRNDGSGRFDDVTSLAGDYFKQMHQGRGLATGDFDGDGDLDVVIVHHHKPSVLLRNTTTVTGNFLKVRLMGADGNRDAIGAKVAARIGEFRQVRTVHGGGGYLSSNCSTLHFGLGSASMVDELSIRWPRGQETKLVGLAANQTVIVNEND